MWATAIALNASLQTLGGKIGTTEKIEILESANNELSKVSFTGALGDVSFDNNGESEVSVNIFQIRNGTAELYALMSNRQVLTSVLPCFRMLFPVCRHHGYNSFTISHS